MLCVITHVFYSFIFLLQCEKGNVLLHRIICKKAESNWGLEVKRRSSAGLQDKMLSWHLLVYVVLSDCSSPPSSSIHQHSGRCRQLAIPFSTAIRSGYTVITCLLTFLKDWNKLKIKRILTSVQQEATKREWLHHHIYLFIFYCITSSVVLSFTLCNISCQRH